MDKLNQFNALFDCSPLDQVVSNRENRSTVLRKIQVPTNFHTAPITPS